jgi:hypothetical protein
VPLFPHDRPLTGYPFFAHDGRLTQLVIPQPAPGSFFFPTVARPLTFDHSDAETTAPCTTVHYTRQVYAVAGLPRFECYLDTRMLDSMRARLGELIETSFLWGYEPQTRAENFSQALIRAEDAANRAVGSTGSLAGMIGAYAEALRSDLSREQQYHQSLTSSDGRMQRIEPRTEEVAQWIRNADRRLEELNAQIKKPKPLAPPPKWLPAYKAR